MKDRAAQMREDRALRDASRALVDADIAHLKSNLAGKSLGERFVDRVSEGAVDMFEEAVEVADSNRGVIASLVAAIFVWLARNPILALLTPSDGEESGDEA